MSAVARLVPYGVTACDVGCDHGFVSIYLVREKICPRVIAMDIHQGPLARAKEHIEEAGLTSYIETRLSDGLTALKPGEADCMIAAGMGGRLLVKILEEGLENGKRMPYLVLQPQSELVLVRAYLREKGYSVTKEDMVLEDGKFYPMMLAEDRKQRERRTGYCGAFEEEAKVSGRIGRYEEPDSAVGRREEKTALQISLEDEFGPCLIRERHPVLLEYLTWWEGQQKKILKEVAGYPARTVQVEEELMRIYKVREWMRAGEYDEVL